MDKKILSEMFDNLLHIGNKSNYWNPRMKNYIYGSVNGIHVINLVKTVEKLDEIKAELKQKATEGKKILFVATKLQARDAFAEMAQETGHYYVTEKWVPGLLTNFKTIKRRIATYLQLLKDSTTGGFDILTKKEKASKLLELDKLDKAFRGLKEMKKTPDLIFVVDGIFEKQAVKEANSLNIPVLAISNTNGDDLVVSNLIPANTNSVKSLGYLADELKSTLSGIKVVAPVRSNKATIKKFNPANKVSGEKRTPVIVKKEEVKAAPKTEAKEEVKKETETKAETK